MGMFVAFLRGMNLGRRRVKNEELCECFEHLGFSEVSAFLASGNVIFGAKGRSAAKLEASLEKGLGEWFEYEVKTFVRTAAEVAAIGAHAPFDAKQLAGTAGRIQVAMLARAPAAAARKAALALAPPDDLLHIDGRELYWLPKAGLSDSELDHGALAKALGTMTIRTQRTITRLAAKLGA